MDAASYSPRSALELPETPRLSPPPPKPPPSANPDVPSTETKDLTSSGTTLTNLGEENHPSDANSVPITDLNNTTDLFNNAEHTTAVETLQTTQQKIQDDPRHQHLSQGKPSTPGTIDAASYSPRPAITLPETPQLSPPPVANLDDTDRVVTKSAHTSKTHPEFEDKIGSQGLSLDGYISPEIDIKRSNGQISNTQSTTELSDNMEHASSVEAPQITQRKVQDKPKGERSHRTNHTHTIVPRTQHTSQGKPSSPRTKDSALPFSRSALELPVTRTQDTP